MDKLTLQLIYLTALESKGSKNDTIYLFIYETQGIFKSRKQIFSFILEKKNLQGHIENK